MIPITEQNSFIVMQAMMFVGAANVIVLWVLGEQRLILVPITCTIIPIAAISLYGAYMIWKRCGGIPVRNFP